MYFKNEEHKERFLELLEKYNRVYDGLIENEYGAAFYILSADNEIWSKSKGYIGVDGIDFETMFQEKDFSTGYAVMVKLAANLFNGNFNKDITPIDLCWCLDGDSNFKIALAALQIRKYKISLEEITTSLGRPKRITFDEVQELKNKGFTQERAARELNVSISTIRRNWG